jgi:hypothetical protein
VYLYDVAPQDLRRAGSARGLPALTRVSASALTSHDAIVENRELGPRSRFEGVLTDAMTTSGPWGFSARTPAGFGVLNPERVGEKNL